MLAHVSMWVLFVWWWCPPSSPNVPVQCRMNAVWLTSDLFTVLQCGCSRVPECQNYTARCPLSFLLCFLCYRVLLPDRAQLDFWTPTTPPLGDTELAPDLWWRAAELNLGGGRADWGGRKIHAYFLLQTKKEQTFHWITTLQWQRGVRK